MGFTFSSDPLLSPPEAPRLLELKMNEEYIVWGLNDDANLLSCFLDLASTDLASYRKLLDRGESSQLAVTKTYVGQEILCNIVHNLRSYYYDVSGPF